MKEALKMALEALETELSIDWTNNDEFNASAEKMYEAITAIKEALAQTEQEPVALPCCGYADSSAIKWNPYSQVVQCHNCGQVYTTPPQRTWVGLTDEEMHDCWDTPLTPYGLQQARAMEAKLKQKNGYAEEKT